MPPSLYDSQQKIARGVRQRERERDGKPIEAYAAYRGAPLDAATLDTFKATLSLEARSFSQMIAGISTALAAFVDARTKEFAQLPLSATQKTEMIAKLVKDERKKLLAVGADARDTKYRKVKELASKVALVSGDITSSIGIVERSSTTHPIKFRQAVDRLRDAGVRQLERATREALALGGDEGMALFASIMQRLDSLSEKARADYVFEVRDICDTLAHERVIAVKEMVQECAQIAKTAEREQLESLGNTRAVTQAKLVSGIESMREEGRNVTSQEMDEPDDEPDNTSLGKIERGLLKRSPEPVESEDA